MVRITVDRDEAAAAVPYIRDRLARMAAAARAQAKPGAANRIASLAMEASHGSIAAKG